MKKIVAIILLVSCLSLLCACGVREPREVRTAEINEKGELVIIFTDGTSSTVGMVKGERGDAGADGADGKDGIDGKDGKDGEDGEAGATGQRGPQGAAGRSISDVSLDGNGSLVITYSDSTTSSITLLGELFLFGGQCGEAAYWGLYNGGILVISGEGATYDYTESNPTPWTSIIPMINAVFVDTSNGLTEGTNLLSGIDESLVTRPEATVKKWVYMTVSASIYSTADNTTAPIGQLPMGTELDVLDETDGWTHIVYGAGSAYIETEFTRDDDGPVIYTPVSYQVRVIRGGGANLRTYPDATKIPSDNTYDNVAQGTVLSCTGISKNKEWYRISYDGQALYAWHTWVEIVE